MIADVSYKTWTPFSSGKAPGNHTSHFTNVMNIPTLNKQPTYSTHTARYTKDTPATLTHTSTHSFHAPYVTGNGFLNTD